MSVNIISSLFSRSAIKNAVPSACRWSSTAATSNFTGQRPQPVQSVSIVPHMSPLSLSDLKIGRPPVSRRKVNKPNRLRFLEDQKARTESRSLEKFQTRPWQTGDVYAPRDLSPVEMKKWGRRQAPSKDAFDGLNINPLDLYKVGCFAAHASLERSLD